MSDHGLTDSVCCLCPAGQWSVTAHNHICDALFYDHRINVLLHQCLPNQCATNQTAAKINAVAASNTGTESPGATTGVCLC